MRMDDSPVFLKPLVDLDLDLVADLLVPGGKRVEAVETVIEERIEVGHAGSVSYGLMMRCRSTEGGGMDVWLSIT